MRRRVVVPPSVTNWICSAMAAQALFLKQLLGAESYGDTKACIEPGIIDLDQMRAIGNAIECA